MNDFQIPLFQALIVTSSGLLVPQVFFSRLQFSIVLALRVLLLTFSALVPVGLYVSLHQQFSQRQVFDTSLLHTGAQLPLICV